MPDTMFQEYLSVEDALLRLDQQVGSRADMKKLSAVLLWMRLNINCYLTENMYLHYKDNWFMRLEK